MKRVYKNIDEFTTGIEEESLKEYLIETGVFTEDDFRGMFVSCCFHPNDNTPSLQIMDKFYKCYSCDAKGGFISFIMQRNGLTFMEAVNTLCEHFNCKIENMRSENIEKRSKINLEWDMYRENIANAPEEIKAMQKDYWPIDIGWDKRINYLVLPFTSKSNAILGFTKRVIGEVESGIRPKWKHSSFKEGMQQSIHNIFNLGPAISEINKTKTLIVTEGPKDVIAYRRINIENVICVCGTHNSRNVWDEFGRAENVIMSYDADDAGFEAACSTLIELSSSYELSKIEMVVLPEGKDPYDIDGKELMERYKNRVNALEYVSANISKEMALELYDSTMLHNKFKVIGALCKAKNMTSEEVKSWMNSGLVKPKPKKKDDRKEKLLAVINGTDGQRHTPEEVNKAARLLKLKYKIEI